MTIEVRGAHPSEYPILHDMMVHAFKAGADEEAPLWDYLAGSDPNVTPECARVGLHDGRPVSCSLVVPRRIQTPRGPVPGAVITVVACEPELQGQGYGGAAVRDSLRYMAEQGLAVAILYGHPGYYPRFGFAPVLAHWDTTLTAAEVPGGEPLAAATEGDLPALTELFLASFGQYPCAELRDASPWFWNLRSPGQHALLKLPEGGAYALASENARENSIDVHEAAAVDAGTARLLLAGLKEHMLNRGAEKIRLFLPPDHRLARLGFLLGGKQRAIPAAAGMAAITRWEMVLPAGYGVSDEGLTLNGRLALRASRTHLTQLVLGYRSVADLLLLPGVGLADATATRTQTAGSGASPLLQRLTADFPAGFPRWAYAPFWY
jgi:predicted N-acetyltransferase YhbS